MDAPAGDNVLALGIAVVFDLVDLIITGRYCTLRDRLAELE
jgi:hypothetical protein